MEEKEKRVGKCKRLYNACVFLTSHISLTIRHSSSVSISKLGELIASGIEIIKLSLYKKMDAADAKVLPAILQSESMLCLEVNRSEMGSERFAQCVCPVLERNTTLTRLRLSDALIEHSGAKLLAAALVRNITLTDLEIPNNYLGEEGGVEVGQLLLHNLALLRLDLSSNKLRDKGGTAIASALIVNKHLRRLNLWGNTIGVESGLQFGKALEVNGALKNLDLGCNFIGKAVESILVALCKNKRLRKLKLQSNSLGGWLGHIHDALIANAVLARLDLGCNSLTRADMESLCDGLKANNALRELCLSENRIEDGRALALALEKGKSVRKLELSNCLAPADVEGFLVACVRNVVLTELNLDDCCISEEATNLLIKWLKAQTALETLSLKHTQIIKAAELINKIPPGSSLRKIYLNCNYQMNSSSLALIRAGHDKGIQVST